MKLALLFIVGVMALPLALQAAGPSASDATAQEREGAESMPAQAASTHVMYDAAELKWGEAPAAFEPGAQAVVLSGDPAQPGLFVLRLKAPPGFRIASHWHPTDEHVTLLEGDLTLQMGEGESAHEHTFSPGGYVLLPAKMHHAASTRTGMILQVSAMGPFELIYIDPKDDPRKRSAP